MTPSVRIPETLALWIRHARVSLAVNKYGPGVTLNDEKGNARVALVVIKDESGVVLKDEKGKIIWSAP